MRIRITKLPPAPTMDGFDVGAFRVNHVYNVSASLAQYLIVAGYATPEMRAADRAADRLPRRRDEKPKP